MDLVNESFALDVFIPGENIDLCIPTKEFAEKSSWHTWFNNPKITRYLYQGDFPNTSAAQVKFFEQESASRLLLIISDKTNYIGVISLSHIDLIRKTAEIALTVNSSLNPRNSPMISLESIARITEHGFTTLGLQRISAGQHIALNGWQQRMELLGYKVEGIKTKSFIKGNERADAVIIAALYDDYLHIKDIRGKYWDSSERMMSRVELLPKKSFVFSFSDFFKQEREKYYRDIFSILGKNEHWNSWDRF